MTKGRKTTFEERVEIVQYCIKFILINYSEQQKKISHFLSAARSYAINKI